MSAAPPPVGPVHRPPAAWWGRAVSRVRSVALALWLAAIGVMCGAHAVWAAPASAVLATRLATDGDKARFVIEMDGEAGYRTQVALDPSRVMVDLPPLRWDAHLPGRGTGLVRTVRVAREEGRLRLILETKGAARVISTRLLSPRDGHGPRLVLEVGPADIASLLAASSPPPALSSREGPPDEQTVQDGRPAEAMPRDVGARRVPRPAPRLPLIVLDAGHGGGDPGATSVLGDHEKDITLATARAVRAALEATGRYRVAMTRDSDVFIPLRERPAKARALGADLFISLHANIVVGRPVRGLSIYTLSDKATDREADMLAERENRADALSGMDLSHQNDQVVNILIDLAQRQTRNQSRRFANLVARDVVRDMPLLPTAPLRSAGFAVLTAPDVPSVLIEMGYLSQQQDARLLASPAHQRRFAADLVHAIDGYFGRRGVGNLRTAAAD